jgi:hypothetical protein
LNTRGVDLSSNQQWRYTNAFELSDDVEEDRVKNINECGPYHYRYYLASVWGISVDDPRVSLSGFDTTSGTQLEDSSEGSESTI